MAAPLNRFRVVIFDYDGTLFDTRPAIVHCLQRVFEQSGRPAAVLDDVAAAVGQGLPLPDTLLLLDQGLRIEGSTCDALVAAYRTLYREHGAELVRAFPGVVEVLRRLHECGVVCVVVSNKAVDAIRQSFEANMTGSLIDLVVGDQPGMPNKPDPAILTELILPRYDRLCRDEILMVGDTEIDILFAQRSAIPVCWIAHGYGEPVGCRAMKPDYEISSISELPALVLDGETRCYGRFARERSGKA